MIITLSLEYITSNALKGQQTNMLFITVTGIIWGLQFYLFLGHLSAHIARLKDAGFAKWVGRLYTVWNIYGGLLNALMDHPAETTYTSGVITLSIIIIILYCIPLLMPTAKSEEGSDGDWQSGIS